jgi:hypothetical protein
MRPFRKRESEDLEARLGRERPEPSTEFVASVEDRLSSAGTVRRPQSRLRYGLAAGFAASLAVVFGAAGGFGTFSTPSTQAASSRVMLAVPAKAVPALKALEAKGAILAASSAQVTGADLKAGKVKGIVLTPVSSNVNKAVANGTAKRSGLKLAPVDTAVRTNLVPSSIGRNLAVTHLAANVVYVPGVFVPICYPIVIGSTTYYYSVLWPIASPLPPGATIGFCPGQLL